MTNLVLHWFSPMDYAVQLMSPLIALSRVDHSLLKRGAKMSLHQETTAHLHWHQLDNEQQKDLGSVRFRGAAAHFSNGTTCTTTWCHTQTSRLHGVPILNGQCDKITTAPWKESSSKPQTVGQQVSQEAALASWRKLAAWVVRLCSLFKVFSFRLSFRVQMGSCMACLTTCCKGSNESRMQLPGWSAMLDT